MPNALTYLLVGRLQDLVLFNEGLDILWLGELEHGDSVNAVGHCDATYVRGRGTDVGGEYEDARWDAN